jgi:ActR/RegA family two-component response regulator
VHLAARSRGNNVVVEIYDTGPGIEPQKLQSVFREFERSREQASGPNAGLGLGLSIVQRYASLIDAEVTVRSITGRGSRFKVEVPKLDHKLTSVAVRKHASPVRSIAAVNVILVDDDCPFLDALRIDLTDRGANVRGFSSVQDAITAVNAGLPFDVAVVDYDIGDDMKGVGLISLWRQQGRRFGATILTGRTDASTLSVLNTSGVHWMTKPADPDSIAMAIERLSATERRDLQPSNAIEMGTVHYDSY